MKPTVSFSFVVLPQAEKRYKGNNFPSQSTTTIRHLVASLARRAWRPAHWARKTPTTASKPASGGWAQLHRLHAIAPSLTNVELQITSTERQPQFLSAWRTFMGLWICARLEWHSTGRAASVQPRTWSECYRDNILSFGLSQPRFRFPAPILLCRGRESVVNRCLVFASGVKSNSKRW